MTCEDKADASKLIERDCRCKVGPLLQNYYGAEFFKGRGEITTHSCVISKSSANYKDSAVTCYALLLYSHGVSDVPWERINSSVFTIRILY